MVDYQHVAKTKGFKVDPHKLEDVANAVKQLLADVAQNNSTGNLQYFTKHCQGQVLTDQNHGLGVLYGTKENPFATSYQSVYEGVQKTYDSMKTQLQNLYDACHSTAEQYKKHDETSKKDVSKTGEW